MKILQVNKFLYPNAGTEAYMFGLAEDLRSRNHEVAFFSMKHPRNIECPEEPYFVEEIDYSTDSLRQKIGYAAKIIYSREAGKKIARFLDTWRPDVVHLHNFHHQLSPSILRPLRRRGIPAVMTVHDLKILCPNYTMVAADGEVCERCRRHRYYHSVIRGCVKHSRAASLVNAVEMTLHWLLGSHGMISTFLTPSQFYRGKLIEWGVSPGKVVHVPNAVDVSQYLPVEERDPSLLFAGRLSKEKGIFSLLHALERIPEVRCRIAGTGPEERAAKELARKLDLDNVEFLGFVPRDRLRDIMARSRALVMPSEWYENGPMVALESLALARPVIGSRIGGIPELVQHEITGLLFEPGNIDELARCMDRLAKHSDEADRMGREGRRLVDDKHTLKHNTDRVVSIYEDILGRRKDGP